MYMFVKKHINLELKKKKNLIYLEAWHKLSRYFILNQYIYFHRRLTGIRIIMIGYLLARLMCLLVYGVWFAAQKYLSHFDHNITNWHL